MSDIHPMKKPWSVVGAGFNDEGVYFTFDDTVIHRDDINLMQAAPELLEALQDALHAYDKHGEHSEWDSARAAIAKALGQ
ncbi:MAG: hypothetical protein E7G60_05240 [Pantoea sp.]|nr:hypothetical protein [Pantoea sp.]